MMKNTTLVALLLLVFLAPIAASAAILNIWEGTGGGTDTTSCNIKPYHCTICDGGIVTINVIKFLLTLAIIVAVLMTLYGGIRLMISGGSSSQLSTAKSVIVDALVGLLIVSLAWVMVNTIFKVLTTRTWNVLDLIGCQGGKFDAKGAEKNANEGERGKQGTSTTP